VKICWKHKREMFDSGHCVDCGGKPPPRPKAYADTIKEASIKLSYAFPYENESERNCRAEYWEGKLRDLILLENYEIVGAK